MEEIKGESSSSFISFSGKKEADLSFVCVIGF